MGRTLAYHIGFFKWTGRKFFGIHLGSGGLRIQGFLNLDADVAIDCDVVARSEKLKVAENSVGTIYASHLFEHITRRKVAQVVQSWFHALEPGGKLLVCVPDLEALARIYLESLPHYDTAEGRHRADLAAGIIYGGQVDQYDFHYGGYSFATLAQLLVSAGFKEIRRFDRSALAFAPFHDGGYAMIGSTPVSLNVEATK